MKDYFVEDIGQEVRKMFRDNMEGHFEHDLYNKSFYNQPESDETDTLQQKIKWWMVVVDRRSPTPNNVYDHSFDEMFGLYRKAIDPEMQDLAKALGDRLIISKELSVSDPDNN